MNEQVVSSLLNLLVTEVLSSKAEIASLKTKLDDLADDVKTNNSLLRQVLEKIPQRQERPEPVITRAEIEPPKRKSKEAGYLKELLATVWAVEGQSVVDRYGYLYSLAGGLLENSNISIYINQEKPKTWINIHKTSKAILIEQLNEKAAISGIHLGNCKNSWGARLILRRKLSRNLDNEKKKKKKAATTSNAVDDSSLHEDNYFNFDSGDDEDESSSDDGTNIRRISDKGKERATAPEYGPVDDPPSPIRQDPIRTPSPDIQLLYSAAPFVAIERQQTPQPKKRQRRVAPNNAPVPSGPQPPTVAKGTKRKLTAPPPPPPNKEC